LALRYEDAETERKHYDDNNRNILASTRNNSVEEWLPGAAFTYQVSDAFQLLAGAHKGMALPSGGAKDGIDPELSINYEFGGRYNNGDLSGELIGFYSDYENTVQNCSNANPCDDDATTGTYSLGESEVQGLEAVLAYNGLATDSLTFPLSATYTYTDAEISTTADGGEYTKGDEIRYIPENQLALTAGVVASGWSSHLRAKYVSSSCTETGCNQADDNTFSKTDDLFVIDFVARIDLAANTSTYVKVDNILNEQEIVSRSPYGARGNKPRTAIIGVDFNF
jgi:Fe(3+) dicitrate transport protein